MSREFDEDDNYFIVFSSGSMSLAICALGPFGASARYCSSDLIASAALPVLTVGDDLRHPDPQHDRHRPAVAVYGEDDLPNVHRLQAGLKVLALADWGQSNAPLPAGQPMRPIRRAGTKDTGGPGVLRELGETLKDITVRDDEIGFARQLEALGITLKDASSSRSSTRPPWPA